METFRRELGCGFRKHLIPGDESSGDRRPLDLWTSRLQERCLFFFCVGGWVELAGEVPNFAAMKVNGVGSSVTTPPVAEKATLIPAGVAQSSFRRAS